MPSTFIRSFRIRYHECDANGHLNNAAYLRLMQETAMDASADVNYDEARYNEMGRIWLPHQTEIEYFTPVGFEDGLEVVTWVADFRRASSRRIYQFYDPLNERLIAQAHTDWIFLSTSTWQPASIPRELSSAFFPEGIPETFPPRQPFPKAPPPPPGAYRWRRQVEWVDIDSMQHVNNAVYLDYAGECGALHVASAGWPWERMKADGFAIFLRRNHIQYKQPALLRDELEVSTWLYHVRRSTAMRVYTIRRASDDALLAEVHALGVCVDLASGEPRRFPAEMLEDLKSASVA